MGVKDYAVYYDNISERMPLMLGFNLPAFKFLDVVAVEAEYYTNPYFNNNRNQLFPNLDNNMPAIPYVLSGQGNDTQRGHEVVTATAHRWKCR